MLRIIACVIIADFLTGLGHWWEDTYGRPTWPVVGPHVIVPNIEHHKRPNQIGMGEIIDRNFQPFAVGAIVFWFIGAAVSLFDLPAWFFWHSGFVILLAACGNEVHAWSHRANGPVIGFLHDTGLVQSPKQHAKHHKPPFDRYYCTLTNLTNAVLEPLRFWRGLEWVVERVSGIAPKRGTFERGGY